MSKEGCSIKPCQNKTILRMKTRRGKRERKGGGGER